MNMRERQLGLSARNQGGAALVVGLLLLIVLTLLAISGMNTSTLELQMAGNSQSAQSAFQAAETGVEQAIQSGEYDTTASHVVGQTYVTDSTTDHFSTTTEFNADNGETPVPDAGYSMGVSGGFSAYHFDVTSTGASSRGARTIVSQSFYVVGPSGT